MSSNMSIDPHARQCCTVTSLRFSQVTGTSRQDK